MKEGRGKWFIRFQITNFRERPNLLLELVADANGLYWRRLDSQFQMEAGGIEMNRVWEGNVKPPTRSQEAARVVISQHASDHFCTHIEVLPADGRSAFKIGGRYDMTLEDAVRDANNRERGL